MKIDFEIMSERGEYRFQSNLKRFIRKNEMAVRMKTRSEIVLKFCDKNFLKIILLLQWNDKHRPVIETSYVKNFLLL